MDKKPAKLPEYMVRVHALLLGRRRRSFGFAGLPYWHSDRAVSITSPHSTILKPFFLPDFDFGLDHFQTFLSRLPTGFAMWRGDGDEDTFFADVDPACGNCD